VLPNANLRLTGLPQRRGLLRANQMGGIDVAGRALPPGRYVTAIRFAASMNPERSTTVIGEPFVVR
jgi:hypothetical protein